tara:strand:+ start:492 stop:797 length:306 start_codon:yes stop_codon:yes gene_type:complete
MRKITIELYANSEYSLDDRLKEIRWAINRTVWPSSCFSEGSRKQKETGCIEEEKQLKLSDYEYEKEDPTWRYGSNFVTTGKWKMEIVPDEDYVNFQGTSDL